MLKEFRGHISFVNDAIFSVDGYRVISASSDGTVKVYTYIYEHIYSYHIKILKNKIWDSKTAECLATMTLHEGQSVTSGVQSATVNKILQMPSNIEHVVISNKSSYIYIVSIRGKVSLMCNFLVLTYKHTLIHTYIPTFLHIYIHIYIKFLA